VALAAEGGPPCGFSWPSLRGMAFPQTRLRRLRRTAVLRDLVRETDVLPRQLVLPLFVAAGRAGPRAIDAMPGVSRHSIDSVVREAGEAAALGLGGVLLFGIPAEKDEQGSEAWDDEGAVQLATRAIKAAHPDVVVITDVCLCEYTSHGHCGLLRDDGSVDNDSSVELLARTAVSHARAGADLVAPSDMMDGRVAAIRADLDAEGFSETPIMAYSAKHASTFYSPFRDAAGSTPSFGDRRGYQMDPANGDEAVREALLDVDEGADVIIVKPALSALDLVWRIKQETRMPVAAYQVSGEYAMIRASGMDERALALETLTAIRRAGADIVITYFAKDAARWLAT
jgi:porphobilinogen synthase